MILRLILSLPPFRDLHVRMMEAEERYVKSQDECRVWQSRCEVAEAERDRSRASEIGALKSLSNWQAMQMGSIGVPFPDPLAHPDAPPESKSAMPQRRLASDVRAEYVARARMAARMPRPVVTTATNESSA